MSRVPFAVCCVLCVAIVACDDEPSGTDAGVTLGPDGAVLVDAAARDATVVDANVVDANATVDAAPPAFRFWVEPSSVVLVPGTCVGIKAKVERLRYDGEIFIGVGATLPSVGVSTTHIAAGTSAGDVTLITPPLAQPVTGGQLLLAATNDQHRERQLLYLPVDILPRPLGDGGAPDGGFNSSTLEDRVCRSLLDALPSM